MRLARLFAVYAICSRYHSGQWSTGYRLMCRAGTLMRRMGISRPLDQITLRRPEFRRAVMAYYRQLWPYRHRL